MKQSQNQNNKRGRGRGRRQPQNPLSRNYESNGPDVKIRGNTSHIADKYLSLARDALSSGDRVSAENYFQHAEHYLRLIASAKDQQKSSEVKEELNTQAEENGDDAEKQKKRSKRRKNGKIERENGLDETVHEADASNDEKATEPVLEASEASADLKEVDAGTDAVA